MKLGNQNANKRIVLNSLALYLKMIYAIFIALYTTRVVLEALGVEDYGIYTLVAGVISLLTFLNVSMTIATQRYMSIAMGQGNLEKLKRVFETSVTLHLWIGLLIVAGLEIAGLFLFDGFLNIPENRIGSAKIVYQFMILSTFFTINAVPYDAAINSNEHMWVDSLIGFVENTLKLLIAIYLFYTPFDQLIIYSLLTVVVIILTRISKSWYCYRKYPECHFSFSVFTWKDKALMKDMTSFAGWNTFGSIVFVGRNQLIAVILNLFFGASINAAYGIANQVNAQIANFSSTLLKAFNPQITKSEGEGNRSRMLQMANYSTKISFFIFSVILIPLFIEMDYILNLWLKDIPNFAVKFSQFILLSTLMMQFSNGIMLSIQSIGKLKLYTLTINSIYALNIPFSYFILFWGYPPYYAIISVLVIEVIALISRSVIANTLIPEFSISNFYTSIVFKGIFVLAAASLISFFPYFILDPSLIRLGSVIVLSTLCLSFLSYFFILEQSDRIKIKHLIRTKV